MSDKTFRDKIVKWLEDNDYYAVLHDGHWGKYFHIRTLDSSCEELSSDIYSAFLESYDCEFSDKGNLVLDIGMHSDFKPTYEWLYRKAVLEEDVSEDRYCEKCGKLLADNEIYRCEAHYAPIVV